MRRTPDPFRFAHVQDLDEKIESVASSSDGFYVGTVAGNLVQFEVSWATGTPEEPSMSSKRLGTARLSRKPVEQVHVAGSFVFALSDGKITVLPSRIDSSAGKPLTNDARNMCLHTGMPPDQATEICVAGRKKMTIFASTKSGWEQRQEIPHNEATALAWHQGWIVACNRRECHVYKESTGLGTDNPIPIEKNVSPQIVVLRGNELMILTQENTGTIFNLNTQRKSYRHVMWPRKVGVIGAAGATGSSGTYGSYVFGSSGNQVDIFNFQDQKNCQTFSLDGPAVAACSAGTGKALIATDRQVICLDPVPFGRQLNKLLHQERVDDALDLLNLTFAPEDPQREIELKRFHAPAGWTWFRALDFTRAFLYFTYASNFDVRRVLAFWRPLLPPSVDMTLRPGNEDNAPEPCDIAEFIKNTLQEKPRDGGGSAGEAAIAAQVSVANNAMVNFLCRQRQGLLMQERMQSGKGGKGSPNTELSTLLRIVDTVLLKLLIDSSNSNQTLQEILQSGIRCEIEDCEGFLRQKGRMDMLARLWKAQGMYEIVLREWSSLLNSKESSRIPRADIVKEMADALRCASTANNAAELLRRYVPELLAADPTAVLPVFTSTGRAGQAPRAGAISTDEVVRLLEGHDNLLLGYLEHLLAEKQEMDPQHVGRLALIYMSQAVEERNQGKSKEQVSPLRKQLLHFLENAKDLEARTLLPRAQELELYEEQVVLCYREQRHKEALRILVEVLDALPRAETYCRVTLAQKSQAPQSQRSNANSAADVSVLCWHPPLWAQAVAFRPGRPGTSGERAEAESEDDGRPSVNAQALAGVSENGGSNGARPLLLLLGVLLDCASNAEKRVGSCPRAPVEYREAVVSLLVSYAGHPDLPPHEVIGMIPSDWALEKLSGYLTTCARLCLHQRRASMLEENLSSMAYLKTFSKWATERQRKVSITGDKCCPVCNRRFVDKDSVGKAFVAYPNETCVHLQCKEDPCVCPKTGRNFADNFSVYCNALNMDPTEEHEA